VELHTQATYNKLLQFVKDERDQLEVSESNYFGLVFGEILKYYEYLCVIMPRYNSISTTYVQACKEKFAKRMTEPAGSRELTADEIKELEISLQHQTQLHFELECIFIFTSILLDRTAAATQYYFGPSSGQWRSFKAMKDHLEGYSSNKGLAPLPAGMLDRVTWLHKNVCEFRHLLVVHKHDNDYRVRLDFGTGYSTDDDEAYFHLGLMYPQDEEELVVSEKPSNILNNLNVFLEEWASYLSHNQEKRNLSPNA
jgi:hypothetical protein